jgi:hypothetical protein
MIRGDTAGNIIDFLVLKKKMVTYKSLSEPNYRLFRRRSPILFIVFHPSMLASEQTKGPKGHTFKM